MHDYEAGKLDWLAFDLPVEGAAASEPTIGRVARRDVPTCQLNERLSDLGARMTEGWAWCAVVNADGVLLGRLRRQRLAESPGSTAGEAMEPGPSTYRPSTPAAEMVPLMTKGRFERAFVTDSAGRLLGLVGRQDLEAALTGRAEAARRR